MSAAELRQAAQAERREWGGQQNVRNFPTSSAIHLALAAWLDDIAAGWPWDGLEPVLDWDGDTLTLEGSLDSHALKVARLINGSQG